MSSQASESQSSLSSLISQLRSFLLICSQEMGGGGILQRTISDSQSWKACPRGRSAIAGHWKRSLGCAARPGIKWRFLLRPYNLLWAIWGACQAFGLIFSVKTYPSFSSVKWTAFQTSFTQTLQKVTRVSMHLFPSKWGAQKCWCLKLCVALFSLLKCLLLVLQSLISTLA